ncbi:MAG: MMPL family transporter [Epsilonproteobacteria bacterium]|nr:MMPL family transporter [Campylobacterota bacterium]
MKKFVEIVIRFRWFIAILIPLVTLLLSTNLKHLEFEGSYRIWFNEDSKLIKDYDDFRSTFGNDDSLTISFKNEKGIFTKEALKTIDNITNKLWQTEYIARVDSVTNYQYIHTDKEDADNILVEDFIQDIDSLSQKDLEQKKKQALKEDLMLNMLLSKDEKTTMIVARMTPKAGDDPKVSFKLRADALKIIKPEIEKNGYEFHLNGGPIINTAFIDIAQSDAKKFTPASILLVMVLMFIIFKKFCATILNISVVIFTFLIVLSIQVLLGFKLNNFTANIPVFVVAIGVADAMHLLWVYFMARKKGMQNYDAIHYSMQKNFLPLILTSITTAIGFASLGISNVVPIKTLGIATASGAILAFVLTILFIPAVLAIINPKIKLTHTNDDVKNNSYPSKYADFILTHDKLILTITTLLFVVIGFGIFKVNVDSNIIKYFKKDVPFRADTHFIQDNLTGPMTYEIIVDSKENDGIKNPKFLKEIQRFYDEFYAKFPETRHISSLLDVIKTFNEVMNNSKTIPDNKNLIAQYLLLYTLSLPQGMEINDKMDIDERFLRLSASMNMANSSRDLQMIKWVQEWWSASSYNGVVNGQTNMFAHMQHDITKTLLISISLAIVIISILMLFIFRKPKILPLFIVPNILPIILVVGVMGWLGIDIDMGVAVAGAIIIGVAVDDTIHFMVKYMEAKKRGDSLKDAMHYVMHYAGSAIIFTTIILTMAFLIFVFSHFNPNYHFGIVTASALVIAVLVDLVALPATISIIDKDKKSMIL